MSATAPYSGPSLIRRPLAAALLATLAALVFGLLLAGAGPASAHAALTGSDPQDGAVVDTAPKEVTLSFSEAVAVETTPSESSTRAASAPTPRPSRRTCPMVPPSATA